MGKIADHSDPAPVTVDDPSWSACHANAATRDRYQRQLTAAGFVDIAITDSHQVADGFTSVLVRATKPSA